MKSIHYILPCAMALLLTACGTNKESLQARIPRVTPHATEAPGEALDDLLEAEETRAERIAAAVAAAPDVAAAAVVITGETCIVGILPAAPPVPDKLIALKSAVEKAVLAVDTGITHVAVTASDELFARIATMPESAQRGTIPTPAPDEPLDPRTVL